MNDLANRRPVVLPSLGLASALALALVTATACSCNKKSDEETAKASGMQRLDAAQVKAALSGNTAHGINFEGKLFFYASFHDDATMKIKLGATPADARNAKKESIAAASWRVTDDGRVCSQVKSVGPNPADVKETCLSMYRSGGKFEWFDSKGTLASSGAIDPGLLEDL